MSEPTSKEIREQLGNAISLAFRHFCGKYKGRLWTLIKKATIYLLHMFVFAWFFVGILYPIAASNPETAFLAKSLMSLSVEFVSVGPDDNSSSFWDVLGAIGSILAGTGTIGLLIFGWIKSDEWLKEKKVELIIDTAMKIDNFRFEMNIELNNFLDKIGENAYQTKENETIKKIITYQNNMRNGLTLLRELKLKNKIEIEKLNEIEYQITKEKLKNSITINKNEVLDVRDLELKDQEKKIYLITVELTKNLIEYQDSNKMNDYEILEWRKSILENQRIFIYYYQGFYEKVLKSQPFN